MKHRKIYRDFTHIEEHIGNARKNLMEGFNEDPNCSSCEKVVSRDRTGEICMELDLAINMVKAATAREKDARRDDDISIKINKDGGRYYD